MAMTFELLPTSAHYYRSFIHLARLYSSGVKQLATKPFERLRLLGQYATDLYYLSPHELLVNRLKQDMEDALSLREYENYAMHLDHVQGHDEWKAELPSIEPQYDPEFITARMLALQRAVMSGDPEQMRSLVRTSLSRDLGGLSMLRIYKHSWFGTKMLVDEYNNTAVVTIETLVKAIVDSDLPDDVVRRYRQSLQETLKFYGRSALTLSGGAVLGMKHIGVAKCLWEAGLLPDIISGASAGSIVAAIIGSHKDEEMAKILDEFPDSNLAVFDLPGTRGSFAWAKSRLENLCKTWRTFFDPKHLEEVMETWLGAMTFRDAYNKTGRTLNICVSGKDSFEPRILNYITAPEVLIKSAVCASCAVPGVYPAAGIVEKDPITQVLRPWMRHGGQQFVDGSLDHDIPMRKLAEVFNVGCFLVSQVNPHVRLALNAEEEFNGTPRVTEQAPRPWIHTIKDLLREEAPYRIQQILDSFGFLPFARWISVLNQPYTGQINILPEINPKEYLTMMANPDRNFMQQATRDGEKATWPKMSRIKNCVAIELALLQGLRALHERLHFSPNARAARELQREAARQQSQRGRAARTNFSRRRSLSNSRGSAEDEKEEGGSGASRLRRNASLGHLESEITALRPFRSPTALSPQAGVEDGLGEGLMMTAVAPRRSPE